MLIDREKLTFEERNRADPRDWGIEARDMIRQEFQCFLGISARHHSHFLLVATTLQLVGTIDSHPLYSITEAAVLPYSPQPPSAAALLYAEGLKVYLQSGYFYLSFEYAVSMSLKENKEKKDKFQGRFCWNEQFCRVLNANIQRNWLTPIIKGFACSTKLEKESEIALISRRSFNSAPVLRGLLRDSDDCGYSVETEVLVKVQNREFSFVQLRGTLPVPWETSGGRVGLAKQPLATYAAFRRYWTGLLEKYGAVAVLNLLSEDKREERLTQAFTQLLNQYRTERVQGLTYQALPHSLELGTIDLSLLGFTLYGPGNELISRQQTVPRVNCLDCLRRTETVMEELAQMQLTVLAATLGSTTSRMHIALNSLWTRNATALKDTQNCDFQCEPGLQSDLQPNPTVRVCSWNLAGLKPPRGLEIRNWLGKDRNRPVLVAVGLQEVVRLTAMNSLNLTSNFGIYREWDTLLSEALNEEELAYSALASVDMVGCYLVVFVLNEYLGEVSDLKTDKVQAGFGSYLGNKGAVAVRLRLSGQSVCFLNCHLASGQENVGEREEQAKKILKETFTSTVLDHDIVYLFGDLNFRLSLPEDTIKAAILAERLEDLRGQDQLLSLKSRCPDLQSYQEGRLDFSPTFKYVRKSHSYDFSKAPAWCDRILYSGREIQQVSYQRTESLHSCHRPVSATLLVPSRSL